MPQKAAKKQDGEKEGFPHVKGVTPRRRIMNAILTPVMALLAGRLTMGAYPQGVGVVDTVGVIVGIIASMYIGGWHLASAGRSLLPSYVMGLSLTLSYGAMAYFSSLTPWTTPERAFTAMSVSVAAAIIGLIAATGISILGLRPVAEKEEK